MYKTNVADNVSKLKSTTIFKTFLEVKCSHYGSMRAKANNTVGMIMGTKYDVKAFTMEGTKEIIK